MARYTIFFPIGSALICILTHKCLPRCQAKLQKQLFLISCFQHIQRNTDMGFQKPFGIKRCFAASLYADENNCLHKEQTRSAILTGWLNEKSSTSLRCFYKIDNLLTTV